MKIGLIGGTSPASTIYYYDTLVREYRAKNPLSYPELMIRCVDMNTLGNYIGNKNTPGVVEYLKNACFDLKSANCNLISLTAITPHLVYKELKLFYPELISMFDLTCDFLLKNSIRKIGFVGTKSSMNADFIRKIFSSYGIDFCIPKNDEIENINFIIINELNHGIIRDESKELLWKTFGKFKADNSFDAMVVGCTALPQILKQEDSEIRLVNMTDVHIKFLVEQI